MTNGAELRIILFVGRARRARLTIAELCNGSTHDSDSCCLGSNPSSAASTSLHGQAVKTSPSHGENWGSSPHGGTNIVHALHGRFFCPHARGLRRRIPACAQAFSCCRGPSAPSIHSRNGWRAIPGGGRSPPAELTAQRHAFSLESCSLSSMRSCATRRA